MILRGIVRDLAGMWNLASGVLTVTPRQAGVLHGLPPRETRRQRALLTS